MSKFINSDSAMILTTVGGGFYTVAAPDSINDENFAVAAGLDVLLSELAGLQYSISDTPSADQVEQINAAYGNFIKSLPKPAVVSKSVAKRVAVQKKATK